MGLPQMATSQSPEWFIAELNSSRRLDKEDRYGAWVICPYHGGGRERTGSLHVNLYKQGIALGFFHCLGCHKKGNWNTLAETLGIKQLKASDKVHGDMSFSFSTPDEDSTEIRLPKLDVNKCLPWPLDGWRSIPKQTLIDFNVRATIRRKELEAYIPVVEYKKTVGGIYAKTRMTDADRGAGGKPYLFTDGSWKKTTLFGFDKARKRKGFLWIVEGARDAMKVYSLGGRVVAVLGSNLSLAQKLKVDVIDPEFIIIASDPDDAGDKLAEQIEGYYDNVYRVRFPKNKDPAKLNQVRFDRIMEKVQRLYGRVV